MRKTIFGALLALAALGLAAGCGNSSGNSTTPTTAPTGTATPTYLPTGAPATAVPVGASPSSASVANGNFGMYIVFPVTTSGSGTMTVTGSTTVPALPSGITAYAPASGTTLFYVLLQPSATVTFPASSLQFQLTIPSSVAPQNNNFFGAVYTNDATFPQGYNAWYATFFGAAEDSGQVLTFPSPSTPLTFTAGDSYVFAFYEVPT